MTTDASPSRPRQAGPAVPVFMLGLAAGIAVTLAGGTVTRLIAVAHADSRPSGICNCPMIPAPGNPSSGGTKTPQQYFGTPDQPPSGKGF